MRPLVPSAFVLALVLAPTFAPAAEFYVTPKGADTSDGTLARPFATLARARDAARLVRKTRPADPVTVWVAPGDYVFTEPFVLAAADSGTAAAPVVWRGADASGPVRLLGARRLRPADFKAITDAATLARIDPAARGKIVALDLAAFRVKHAGPFPDVFEDTGDLLDLFCNGERLPLSRFPNQGYMSIKTVLKNGGPKPADGGVFEYREENYARHALWAKQLGRGVWLKGYWRVAWQNEAVRVATIDPAAHTVTFARNIPSGIGNKYTRPAGNGKEKYWLLNLLEEIDRPGEWAVDFKDKKLYLWPPAPLAKSDLRLADSTEPVVRIEGAAHVVLRNFTVESSLGDGVLVKDSDHVLVAGCTVRNVDDYAVRVVGGKENTVLSNDLYNLGAGGVWIGGGDQTATPRIPAGHRVVNNHIHHFSQLVRIYAPGVNCGYIGTRSSPPNVAVGNLVAHNLIHDTPHAGVLFGSWDNVFEYNEIFRWSTVSDDIGAFYSFDVYGRDGGQTFRYNLMHDSEQGDGIYWDCDHRDMHVYGNIAYLKSGQGRGTGFLYKMGTQDQNPQVIDCHDNIAIACRTGFQFVSAVPTDSAIARNASVLSTKESFVWKTVENTREVPVADYGTGPNVAYGENPGFVDLDRLDFRLKPDAALLKDIPGFQKIPVEKIGLFVDEYRPKLPTDAEIDRFNQNTQREDLGYEILDRK